MPENGKIRVLHVIKSLGRGGAEMLLPEALKQHDQDQFEFHYIYFLPWKDQMVNALREAGGLVTCLNASDNLKIMMKTGEVISYCREHSIQLIHCHLPWAGFLGRVVHKRTSIPVIYTEHNKQERYHSITYRLNKLTFNWQNFAIAVSGDVKDSIVTHIHPKIPVETVLNGVDTGSFVRDRDMAEQLRRKYTIPMEAPLIGTVAVFRFQKRLKEWLDVFAIIHKEHPEVRGIIVGDGPLKEEIMEHRNALGLEAVVIMAGLQTEVRPYLSAIDIYMMTSSFEGLPIALLEAMSMECVVATTRAGGISELVRNGVEGQTVEVEKWDLLPEVVGELLKNTELRSSLARKARIRVEKAFGMKRMVDHLEKIYVRISASD